MRYFLDFEFMEGGPQYPLEPISLGIVGEDGSYLYREISEASLTHANEWVQRNVIPHLKRTPDVLRTRYELAKELRTFIPPKPKVGSGQLASWSQPEFWGYFADYDWVLFCQLFGTMMDLPDGYPMFCMDLMQLSVHLGVPRQVFPKQTGQAHNALADAEWNRELYNFLMLHK